MDPEKCDIDLLNSCLEAFAKESDDIKTDETLDDILSAAIDNIERRGRRRTKMQELDEQIDDDHSNELFIPCNVYGDNNCVAILDTANNEQTDDGCFMDKVYNKMYEEMKNIKKNDKMYHELRNILQRFQSYINDEEYDTDSIAEDLYKISQSNILNELHHIDTDIDEMKERSSKSMDSFQSVLCQLFDSNTSTIQCPSLNQICKVLILYHSYIKKKCSTDTYNDKMNIYKDVYSIIDDKYDNVQLLNDFNHLLHSHSDKFEDIYNVLVNKVYDNNPCDLSKCLLMIRNQRDRMKISDNTKILTDLYFTHDVNEIMAQQFIERIHCHFFHAFDIGYKITKHERDEILNKDFKKRSEWTVGNEVFIYSETQNKWKRGTVHKIYTDEYGEWLVIEYDSIKRKEIQRFSKYIQTIDHDFGSDRFVLEISNLVQNKKNKYRKVTGLERIYSPYNKFISKQHDIERNDLNEFEFGFRFFYHKHYEDNNDVYDPVAVASTLDVIIEQHPSNDGYTVGDLYITSKYKTFKEELQNNEICTLSATAWNNLYLKAMVHIITGRARKFICPRTKSAEYYEMKHGDGITNDHLIAMMVYCNFDRLQQKFTETFRDLSASDKRRAWKSGDIVEIYSNSEETWMKGVIENILNDEEGECLCIKYNGSATKEIERDNENVRPIKHDLCDIKKRHSNYYYLGRLLRECVECFGMRHNLESGQNQLTFYHGASRIFKFESLFAYIKGPLSTTTDYCVAVGFSNNQGVIMQLDINVKSWVFKLIEGKDAGESISCFDCKWISDYSYESEIFCIGGLNRFYFKTIIDAPHGINYDKYIKGLKQMTSGMSHGGISADMIDLNIPKTKSETQMAFRLLSHQFYKYIPNHKHAYQFKSCPLYIRQLLDAHCKKIKWISFVEKQQHKVLDAMLKNDDDWIELDLITKIFPNCEEIYYFARHKDFQFVSNPAIYDSILSLIDTNDHLNMQQINMQIDICFKEKIQIFIQENYVEKFQQRGCQITCFCEDPLKEWSDNSGIDIIGYIKMANENPTMKRLYDQFFSNMFDGTNILAAYTGNENFDLWKDYDKLGHLLLQIVISKDNHDIETTLTV